MMGDAYLATGGPARARRLSSQRGRGMDRDDAVVEGSRNRLRPILMTTLAFVAGNAAAPFHRSTEVNRRLSTCRQIELPPTTDSMKKRR